MERTLLTEVRDYLIESLEGREDIICYSCDLASTLTEDINRDGDVECDTHRTIEKIREYWYEYSSVYEYTRDNWGIEVNPFKEPDKFDVIAYIAIAEELLYRCKYIDENWDEEITLTKSIIKKIKRQLNTVAFNLKEYEY